MPLTRRPDRFHAAVYPFIVFSVVTLSTAGQTWADKGKEPTIDGTSQVGGPKILRADILKGRQDGKVMKATLIEVTLPPLASTAPHRHPGSVTGVVLEGKLDFAVGDEPVRTLHKGDTFFEPTMVLHRVARNRDESRPCRFLVTMVHPADAPQLVIPEDVSGKLDAANDSSQTSNESCTVNLQDSVNRMEYDESLPTVGVLLFDDVLMTEVTAPIDVFSKPNKDGKRLFNVITVSRSVQPVVMESGLRVIPDFTFNNCPKLSVLVVSGSYDVAEVVASTETVDFITSYGKESDFVMSNCAGAHLVGASGVADGRKIVTYIGGGKGLQKIYPNLLVQDDREVSFVRDGKMISSNGNLASYISALELLEEMTSKQHRKFVESHLYLDRLQDDRRDE